MKKFIDDLLVDGGYWFFSLKKPWHKKGFFEKLTDIFMAIVTGGDL